MLGYQTSLDKSMNGIKTVTDGQATIENGNFTAINITSMALNAITVTATSLFGLVNTATQNLITSLGTLTGLTVSGITNLATVILSGSLTMNANQNITQSGTGHLIQTSCSSTSPNLLTDITLNNNSSITQTGTGIITQSGGGTNSLKNSNVTRLGVTGDIVQTSGANTLLDTAVGNITQALATIISQTGTGINVLKGTQITDLTITNSVQFPSNVTVPGSTMTADEVFTGTAKINQSGTGTNVFKDSQFSYDLALYGNFNMIGGSSSCSLKTPTIAGTTSLAGDINQTSGVSSLRGLSCNQLSLNNNYDAIFNGTGKISQTLCTGVNLMSDITLNNNSSFNLSGTGILSQIGTGTNSLGPTNHTGLVSLYS